MRADDRTDIGDQVDVSVLFRFQDGFQGFGIIQTVAVGDENRGVRIGGKLLHLGGQSTNGRPAAPDLGNIDEMAFIIHVQHRLDAEDAAEQGRRRADAAAGPQVSKVVYGKPVAEMKTGIPDKLRGFLQGGAFILFLNGQIDQEAEAESVSTAIICRSGYLACSSSIASRPELNVQLSPDEKPRYNRSKPCCSTRSKPVLNVSTLTAAVLA